MQETPTEAMLTSKIASRTQFANNPRAQKTQPTGGAVLSGKPSTTDKTDPIITSRPICSARSSANHRLALSSKSTSPTSTRMPVALCSAPNSDGNRGSPLASLSSSSPLSNVRTSPNRDRTSERSTTNGRIAATRPSQGTPVLQTLSVNPVTNRIKNPVSSSSNNDTSKPRLIASRLTRPSPVLYSSPGQRLIPASRESDNSMKNCDPSTPVKSRILSPANSQVRVSTRVPTINRLGSSASSKILASSKNSKQDASSCGRLKSSTAHTRQPVCPDERSNNLTAVGHLARQQDKRAKLIARPNFTAKKATSQPEVAGKRMTVYKVHNASKRESATIKLRTMQQEEGLSEEICGEKNGGSNSNHKHVNSAMVEVKDARFESEQKESCLPNKPSGSQDGTAKLSVRDRSGSASGLELTDARSDSKQDGQGNVPGKTVNQVGETTSGRSNGDVHDRLRAGLQSIAQSSGPSIRDPNSAVAFKCPSLLQRQGTRTPQSTRAKSLTTSKNDKNGQFVSANNSRTTSSSADDSCSSNIEQHEEQQQASGRLSGQHHLKLNCALTGASGLRQKRGEQSSGSEKCTDHKLNTKGINLPRPERSSTGQLEGKHEILSNSMCIETGETGALSLGRDDLTDVRPIINGRMLPKPMGHQVLSLMMLDAGLLPAGKDNLPNDEGESHVCLQSEPTSMKSNSLMDFPDRTGCRIVDNNDEIKWNRRDAVLRGSNSRKLSSKIPDISSIHPICKEPYHNHVQSDISHDNLRSASLPSSPRASRSIAFKRVVRDLSHDRASEPGFLQGIHNGEAPQRILNRRVDVEFNYTSIKDDENSRAESESVTSSCSSLGKHCPPMLFLSNRMDSAEFSKIIRANIGATNPDVIDSPLTEVITQSVIELDKLSRSEARQVQSPPAQIDQVSIAQSLKTNEVVCGDDPSDEIFRLRELEQVVESASGANEYQLNSTASHETRLKLGKSLSINSASSEKIPIEISEAESVFDQGKDRSVELLRRTSGSRQPRSNSLSGQEFHHLPELHSQRQRQLSQAGFGDPNQFYNQKMREYNSKQFSQNLPLDRSMSPMHANGRQADYHVPKRSSSIKYNHDSRHSLTRNQIHASLECLNSIYTDDSHQNTRQQLPSSHQTRQYGFYNQPQNTTMQSNPYAYVLAAAPTEAVISQRTDQDLAAAAMASPHRYEPMPSLGLNQSCKMTNQSNHHYHLQAGYNSRTTAPMSHSPLHRRLVNGPMTSTLNQITSSVSNTLRAGHSSLSLASSTYLIEEKFQTEIKQLQSELKSEKEKNEALNSQLDINSNLMAAFEQSLTTLNNRLRQMTTLCEKKDKEIDELNSKLITCSRLEVDPMHETSEKSTSPMCPNQNGRQSQNMGSLFVDKSEDNTKFALSDDNQDSRDQQNQDDLVKTIEHLKRQLVEKDRLLTDTRLEALSAAHQLEQLESRLNGEQELLANDDDDEGVMVTTHSPSESEAITESAHLNDPRSDNRCDRPARNNHQNLIGDPHRNNNNITLEDLILFTPKRGHHASSESQTCGFSNHSNISADDANEVTSTHSRRNHDNHSDQSSSDFHDEDKSPCTTMSQLEFSSETTKPKEREFEIHGAMDRMMDNLSVSN